MGGNDDRRLWRGHVGVPDDIFHENGGPYLHDNIFLAGVLVVFFLAFVRSDRTLWKNGGYSLLAPWSEVHSGCSGYSESGWRRGRRKACARLYLACGLQPAQGRIGQC